MPKTLLFLIVFLSVFQLSSCSNDLKRLNTVVIENPIPNAIYKNYEVFYSDSGKTVAKIAGGKLEQFSEANGNAAHENMNDTMHLWFYDDKMKVESELRANRAVRYRNTGIMEAFGNVVVYNEKGEKLNTEHLIWDQKKEKIISNTAVTITKEKQIIKGTGLVSDMSFLNYEILNVTGIINLKK